MDKLEISSMTRKLSSKFELSEDRSFEIASFITSLKKVSNKRSLTENDLNLVTNETLGVDFKEFKNAMTEKILGNSRDAYNELLEKAAEQNEVTPEHMNVILEGILID